MVFDEIDNIKKDGLTKEELQKVKKQLIKAKEVEVQNNNYWANSIKDMYFYKNEIQSLSDYSIMVNEVNNEKIKDVATKFMPNSHYVKGVLLPE